MRLETGVDTADGFPGGENRDGKKVGAMWEGSYLIKMGGAGPMDEEVEKTTKWSEGTGNQGQR